MFLQNEFDLNIFVCSQTHKLTTIIISNERVESLLWMKINMIYWLTQIQAHIQTQYIKLKSKEGWVIVSRYSFPLLLLQANCYLSYIFFFHSYSDLCIEKQTTNNNNIKCTMTTNVFHCYKRYIQAICSLFPTWLRYFLSFILLSFSSLTLYLTSSMNESFCEWSFNFPRQLNEMRFSFCSDLIVVMVMVVMSCLELRIWLIIKWL